MVDSAPQADTAAVSTPETTTTPEVTTGDAPVAPSFGDSIPEQFREKGYMKNIDSMESLLNKFEASQSLIGKKGILELNEGSTPEDIASINDQLGDNFDKLKALRVPESYEYTDMELPEGADTEVFQASTDKFSEIAKAAGLSNKEADGVRGAWLKHEMETIAAREEELNNEFDQMAKEKWGDNYIETQATSIAFLQSHMSEAERSNIRDIPNRHLVAMMSGIDAALQRTKPDGVPTDPQGQGMSKEQAKERYSELRRNAQKNPSKFRKEFNEFQDKTRDLRNN